MSLLCPRPGSLPRTGGERGKAEVETEEQRQAKRQRGRGRETEGERGGSRVNQEHGRERAREGPDHEREKE